MPSSSLFSPLPPLPLLRRRLPLVLFSSITVHRRKPNPNPNPNPNSPIPQSSSPWLQRWPSSQPPRAPHPPAAIDRIVHRLRSLDLTDDEEPPIPPSGTPQPPVSGDERLAELLDRSWNRPDTAIDRGLLPWERDGGLDLGLGGGEKDESGLKRKRVRAPTLAELTIDDSELRRLRREGITLRERITVPKAGVTQVIAEKIHDAWRKSELVRLKFHEDLMHDMKTAHELVERRTGGFVIWRSGSVMVVYRGNNYKRPTRSHLFDNNTNNSNSTINDSPKVSEEVDPVFIPDVTSAAKLDREDADYSKSEQAKVSVVRLEHNDSMTEEEAEYNSLLGGLGPRFFDWWGTGILPVDADLLPEKVPGFKTPLRLLPTGMRSHLTNAEMTNLRKLARSLPCHFALGRNRNHQGLASAILKLWEKSLVAKIAVKRGIQNTNNKLMAEELKALTGGVLLLRNKYYIVIYRGKDFIPSSVATVLAERQELSKDIQHAEENSRSGIVGESDAGKLDGYAPAGTLAEFREAQARWGRNISAEERNAMKEEASRSESAKLFRRIEHKLSIAQLKKLKAEKLLAKIESSMIPVNPSDDQETITDEERSVFRRIGLRMKAYLPLGIRGVFDGVIENMHLHWKHRELVKLISKQKTLAFVEDTARLLEYESGGILVAIERVPKGFALIYYRGKNYQRPISLRPRNLLTKAKALKRAVAMQRHEALSQHIMELERTIKQIKQDLGLPVEEESATTDEQQSRFDETEDEDYADDSEYELDSDDELLES